MAKVNFNQVIQRKKTNSVKYDGVKSYFGKSKLQPLWVADMDFETPKFVQKALKKKIDQGALGYEIISDKFYQAIINWQKKHGLALRKENILFSAGVVPSLDIAIKTFSDIGDEIIIQPPVYFPFFSIVRNNDRKLIEAPLVKKSKKYIMDFELLEKQITSKTKILILCSPHNPVGRVWSKSELQQLSKICSKHKILVISDEIHADIVFKKFTSFLTIDKNALILNAPSKTFNVAGLNSSYMFSKNLDLIKKLKVQIKKAHLNSPNTLSTTVIEQCYSTKGEVWLKELLVYLQDNILYTEKFIKRYLPSIKVIKSEATYLLWLDFSKIGLSHKEIKQKLLNEAKVALNDGITFGDQGEKFFRINIALPKDELKKALNKIYKAFKG